MRRLGKSIYKDPRMAAISYMKSRLIFCKRFTKETFVINMILRELESNEIRYKVSI